MNMYTICKQQYERKVSKGTLTHAYAEKQKVYLGVFLQNDMITLEQFQELVDFLDANDPEKGEASKEESTTK